MRHEYRFLAAACLAIAAVISACNHVPDPIPPVGAPAK
jgi:hypothetical protein